MLSLKKSAMMLFVLLSVVFPLAPAWVDVGVDLNYSMSNGNLNVHVLSVSDSGIKYTRQDPSSPKVITVPGENKSADSGFFWFDPSLIAHTYIGKSFGDLTVSAVGKVNIAGKDWDSVAMQGTQGGAIVSKTFDSSTGMLLKWTISPPTGSAQVMTLKDYYIPSLAQQTAPPKQNTTTPTNTSQSTPPPPTNPGASNQSSPGPGNGDQGVSNATGSQNSSSTQPSQGTAGSGTQSQPTESPSESPDSQKAPCCLTTLFIMLVAGGAIVFRRA